jgi:hypothetical protein
MKGEKIMRRIAEMEEVYAKIIRLRRKARNDNRIDDVEYWNGVIDTLNWVRDKKGEETLLYGHNFGYFE